MAIHIMEQGYASAERPEQSDHRPVERRVGAIATADTVGWNSDIKHIDPRAMLWPGTTVSEQAHAAFVERMRSAATRDYADGTLESEA